MKTVFNWYKILVAITFLSKYSFGQVADTIVLKEITVSSYFKERPYLRAPSSMAIIDTGIFTKLQGATLVPVLNTVPGVRMEERSPGSYRLSIRGSLLRSPFGVRNVKVYMDEFPLTDAGGNTYLNLLDANLIKRIEVLKGPDGSLFGANSGGVVRITPAGILDNNTLISTGITAGSYGLFQQNAGLQLPSSKNRLSFGEASHSYDGYRVNSSMKRQYIQVADRWNYNARGQFRLFFFYSNLRYLTPGGLTIEQWQNNPLAARPPTSTLPGAVQQNAGVQNKTLYGGILHEIKINHNLRQVTAVFGSHTDYENRFITNYEVRNENSSGVRLWFEAVNHREGLIDFTFDIGGEVQQLRNKVINYGNRSGIKDTVQVADHLNIFQRFGFARLSVDMYNRLTMEASASINDNLFIFNGIEPVQTLEQKRVFTPQLMPRVSMSYLFLNRITWRASVSRGYSPPTFDEIRSSDKLVNTSLQPEWGWNYETGFRLHDKKNRIWWDGSVFYYRLQQAIVRRTNNSGQEYFVNAGKTSQPGFESQLTLNLFQTRKHSFFKQVQLTNSLTCYQFKFNHYQEGTVDYSGNYLTGVPKNSFITGLTMKMPLGFFAYAQHHYTSRIPLNDSNSRYADSFHLMYLKAGWISAIHHRLNWGIYFGIDNLLNERYSLGNDLNAPGGRYYNPASDRNYFVGLHAEF